MLTTHKVTSTSAGVTRAAGTASSSTKIISYQIQPGSNIILDRDSVLMLKDRGTTETANQSNVLVKLVSATQKKVGVLADTSYNELKYNQDTRIQFHPISGEERIRLRPFSYLEVWANSDQTIATATLDFYLTAKEEAL